MTKTSGRGKPLLHLAKKLGIGGDHIAGRHRIAALDVDDAAAGFADDEYSGGQIPRLEATFPKGIETARRDIGKIETGGAGAAQPGDLPLKGGKLAIEPGEGIGRIMRQAA